jgi:hypothetical protein
MQLTKAGGAKVSAKRDFVVFRLQVTWQRLRDPTTVDEPGYLCSDRFLRCAWKVNKV